MSNEVKQDEVEGAGTMALTVGKSNMALQVRSIGEAMNIAKYVIASGLAPKGLQNPEAVFIAMQMGSEIGLPIMQSVQSIAVINGRPSLWGDTMLGLVRASGECEKFQEYYEGKTLEDFCAVCVTRRRGDTQDTIEKFSVSDAKKAGLWGKAGPWTTHPKRMLKYKARNFILRDVYPDILRGLQMAEVLKEEPIDVTGEVEGAALPKAKPEAPTVASSLDSPKSVLDQVQPVKKTAPKAKKVEAEKPKAEEKKAEKVEKVEKTALPDPDDGNDGVEEVEENPFAGDDEDSFSLDGPQ